MRSLFVFPLALAITGICVAQTEPVCKATSAVKIDDREGVTFKTVSFQGPLGPLSAYVFLPDTEESVAGIAFSQSAIQYSDSRTDLRPFARALARAGAASIMVDGTIPWPMPNDDAKRPMAELACAADWLLANANLDVHRLAIGGPIKTDGPIRIEDAPFCPGSDKQPCANPVWYINFGWAGPHEIRYTEMMKTPQGQLRYLLIPNFPKALGLKEVRLEWLMESVLPGQMVQH
jgi:hypothetical protein